MKYRITVSEEQMRMLEKCTNMYMRLMMGQVRDLADELAFHNIHKFRDRSDFNEIHSRACDTRDAIYEVLSSVMRIVFQTHYGVPHEKSEDAMIAECLWDSIRFARGTSRWGQPFQIGSEPVPEIEVIK